MSWSPECTRILPAGYAKGKDDREVPLRQYIHSGYRTTAAPHPLESRDNSPSRCNTPSLTNGDSWEGSSSCIPASHAGVGCAEAAGFPAGDGDLSDEESDSNEEDADDWSGQESDAETIVIAAVGNDLELAAYLIPIVHKMLATEHTRDIDFKVGSWRSTMDINTLDGGSPEGSSPVFPGPQGGGRSRKRQRRSDPGKDGQDPDDDDDDEGEDRDKDGGSEGYDENGNAGPDPVLRLACPFHKFDSRKYGIQHEAINGPKRPDYKTCSGPGFKNIQRLKEHLKRKHSPVQCERCYELFPGTDRSGCILRLEAHRQLETSCQRGDSVLKEGISEAQWARLEGKRGNKTPQKAERVEKWYEIWDVLFPQRDRPASPWYDGEVSNKRPKKVSAQTSSFMDLYRSIMDHKVQHHDIDFSSPGMRERIEVATQVTFSLWIEKHRAEASTNSTSSQPFPHSLLGGSSTRFSGQPSASFPSYHPSHGSSGAQHSRTSSYGFQPAFPPHALDAGGPSVPGPSVPDPRYVAPWTPTGSDYALAGSATLVAVPPFHMHPPRTTPMEAAFSRGTIDDWSAPGPFADGHHFTLSHGPAEFQVPVTTGGIPDTFLEAPMDAMTEMDLTNSMTFHHES